MAPQLLWFFVTSFIVHFILVYSPQDIHFKLQPTIIKGSLKPRVHSLRPPAKRVVLFALDRVTANDVYSVQNKEETRMPFVRRVVTHKGRWGIAYSDGTLHSYLTGRGKEEQKEEMDNILHSTVMNWFWCSETSNCLTNVSVASDSSNIYKLRDDGSKGSFVQWISSNIEELFLIKGNEDIVDEKLQLDKSLFYFSLDASSLQLENIDTVIENIFNLFTSYFSDGKTAFIITSLYNESINVSLPFVAWGAGIKNPRARHHGTQILNDDWSEIWGLDYLERLDIQKIDIAPLISVLIGIYIPIYSLGTVPVPYIHYNKEFYTEITYTNALQLLELVRAKEESISSVSLPFLFRPYKKLTQTIQEDMKKSITNFIHKRKLQEGLELSLKLISTCKEALQYYDTYHYFSLKLAITIMTISWMIYLLTLLIKNMYRDITLLEMGNFSYAGLTVTVILSCTLLITLSLIKYQGMSLYFSVYFMVPVPCLLYFFFNKQYIWLAVNQSAKFPAEFYKTCSINVASMLIIELIVFGFYYSSILILLWITLAIYPYFSMLGRKYWKTSIYWSSMCLLMVLVLINSDHQIITSNHIYYKIISSLLMTCLTLFLLSYSPIRYTLTNSTVCSSTKVYIMQMIIIFIATVLVETTVPYIKWSIVIVASLPILVMSYSVFGRLLHLTLYIFTLIITIIPSSSNDGTPLFFILLCFLLYGWLLIEDKLVSVDNKITASIDDTVISYTNHPSINTVTSLVPENDKSLRPDITQHFRRSVMMTAIMVTIIYYLLPSTNGYSSLLEFVMREQVFFVKLFLLMTALVFCYNILSSLMSFKSENSLVVMVFIFDIISLHLFHFIERDDSFSLLLFHTIISLTLVIPLFMISARLFTGYTLTAKKSTHLN